MDMNQMAVERDISDFRELVGRLNRRINDAGDLWKDEKYRELRDSISHMASDSRRIFAQSEQCDSALRRFMTICGED